MEQVKQMIQKTGKFKVVSFDLFDTLMYRSVPHPDGIFDLVENQYNEIHDVKLKKFRSMRKGAEEKARKKAHYTEVNIGQIYALLPVSDKIKAECMELEKSLEAETCVPNSCMLEVLNQCRNRGQQVIITTDMYLDRKTIESLLAHIGVKQDMLFISSEECATKVSGKLFEIVLKKLGILPEELCHIGDDTRTDIEMPRSYGITAYERIDQRAAVPLYPLKKNTLPSEVQDTFIQNHMQMKNASDCVPARIGYSVLGPFLYSLCQWIHDGAEADRVAGIAFVAREGYLVKQAYDIMYPKEGTKTKYIRLNKNMIRLPGLYLNPSAEQFLASVPYQAEYSWEEIASLLFIEDRSPFEEILNRNGCSLKQTVSRMDLGKAPFCKVLREVLDEKHARLKEQYQFLLRYLKQNQMAAGEKIYLVNNSMNGSAQKALERILKEAGIKSGVVGVQFLATKACRAALKQVKVWFDEIPSMGNYEKEMFGQYAIVLEHLLFEENGTAEYLYEKDDQVDVKCAAVGMERENHETVAAVQAYALQFIRDRSREPLVLPASAADSVERLMKLLLDPYAEDAAMIGGILDLDYNGVTKLVDCTAYAGKSYREVRNAIKDFEQVKWGHGLLSGLKHGRRWKRWYDLERRGKSWIKGTIRI